MMNKSAHHYLRKVMKNIFLDKIRKVGVNQHVSLDDEHNKDLANRLIDETASEAIQNKLYYEERLKSFPLRVAMEGLSKDELEILYMNAVEEKTPREIAAAVDAEVTMIRYRLNRIYAKLRYRARKLGE